MKKNYTLVLVISFLIFQLSASAQDTIVQWTFPTELANADGASIPSNLDQVIETAGGASSIQFKNGSTTKAAQATQWNEGDDQKKWRVDFETTGYTNLKLSSKISSGGQNPGPRDFKVQYRTSDGGWTDVPDSDFQVANDWTTGVLVDLAMPDVCEDQSIIKLRWIMTSNIATDGNDVGEQGISKIDDIYITGDFIDGNDELFPELSVSIYPNPAFDVVIVESMESSEITICDISGRVILREKSQGFTRFNVSDLESGIYVITVVDNNTIVKSEKIMIN